MTFFMGPTAKLVFVSANGTENRLVHVAMARFEGTVRFPNATTCLTVPPGVLLGCGLIALGRNRTHLQRFTIKTRELNVDKRIRQKRKNA